MEFFLKNPKLESGGLATPRIGIGTAAAPAALGFAALGFLWPGFFAASAALLLVFGICMAGFYGFVARHRPGFLPSAIVLNIYFSSVIACGAAYGVMRSLAGRGRAASAQIQTKP
jgi:hypothetical protein